jgi:predicted nucleic acid-binding protein
VTTAYLDSSVLLSIAFREPTATGLQRILGRYDRLVSSDLIVAECLSAAQREEIDHETMLTTLRPIALILLSRSLAREMREALDEGPLRGADLWHVACAMFLAADARAEVAFLSRDQPQRRLAKRVGFQTP